MKRIDLFKGTYFFLSNFFERPVFFNGLFYQNNEAAFQSMKTLDEKERATFCNLKPSEAKKKGRHIKLRDDWEKVKYDYMYLICKAKFTQNEDLRQKLLDTKDAYLEEGTTGWCDNEWGNCECPKCKNIVGQNHLGKILMRIREEFFIEDILTKEINYAKKMIEENKVIEPVVFFDSNASEYSKDILKTLQVEFMRSMGYYLFKNYPNDYIVFDNSNAIMLVSKQYYFDNHLYEDYYKKHFASV